MITTMQIQEAVQRIVAGYNPDQIILFGSYAYGVPTDDSDLDLLIIKNTTDEPRLRDRTVRNLLRELFIPTDILVYTPSELAKWQTVKAPFENYILQNGKILYGRG